ncbi:MAG: hypothetical protein PWP23_1840 [Candidatus Sumerlaeota bacterium]|nr:hypothetical protein [Candidatus Sumerlaeota bacterium]
MDPGRSSNPFSSRHVTPAAVPYIFPEGRTLGDFLAPLEENGWTGELAGPEGAGKTTLLFTIAAELRRRGLRSMLFRIREERPRLPLAWRLAVRRAAVVLVDSAELLRPSAVESLIASCQRRKSGLLLTTHVPFGLGLSCRVEPHPECFHALVARLLAPEGKTLGREQARALLLRHGGNAREALFDLYEQWERGALDQ